MSGDPLRWPRVVATSAMPRSEVRELERQGWWRPTKGFLVEPRQEKSFTRQRDYYLGYVGALSQQSPGAVVFTGTTAAMLLGHPVWPRLDAIDIYRCKGRREVRTLRSYPTSTVPVPVRAMRRPNSLRNAVDLGNGVVVATRERTGVDVARLAASQSAFIVVCSILGRLATSGDRYRDRNDKSFLAKESAARAKMMEMAEHLSNTAGRQRAMGIISRASGQVESVAEARVLWLVCAYGLPMPLMQYRIVVDGKEFFGDFVWPEAGLIVEFNGEGKYGTDDARSRRVADERARESLLRSAGFEVLNLSWDQLKDHRHVALLIHRYLRSKTRTGVGMANLQIRRDLSRPSRALRMDSRISKQATLGPPSGRRM
ncbi:hypothetical protein VR010_06970 [Actinomycetaceae bacterium L2_0104]